MSTLLKHRDEVPFTPAACCLPTGVAGSRSRPTPPGFGQIVLCRPDAWVRVSFAHTRVSIVGWIYDPDHSFVVSTYGFLIERNRAFACAATTRSRLRRSRVDLASRSRRFRISTSTRSTRRGSPTRCEWAAPRSIVRRMYYPDHSLRSGMYVDVPHLDCLLIAAPITVAGLDQVILKPKQLEGVVAVNVDSESHRHLGGSRWPTSAPDRRDGYSTRGGACRPCSSPSDGTRAP